MTRMRWAASLDMYRKVPADLLEGTKRGSVLSYLALTVMLTLVVLETKAYLNQSWSTHLSLDNNPEDEVRVNFNITMLDLKCEFAVVDTVSVLGTDQNITAQVSKWHVDADGIRRRFGGRNRYQTDLVLYDHDIEHTIEELIENGEDAISLDDTTFPFALNENEFLFVDFYASWCSHCIDLAPTWETLAEIMDTTAHSIAVDAGGGKHHEWTEDEYNHAKKVALPVMIAKVDCVLHPKLCQQQNVRAYPLLRLFIDGRFKEDYRSHRTVIELTDWLNLKEEDHKKDLDGGDASATTLAQEAARSRMMPSAEESEWAKKVTQHKIKNNYLDWIQEDHPGCQISGYLMLDRVPGNFHIQARSNNHDLVPHMTNVSHIVHHLFIGEPMAYSLINNKDVAVPEEVHKKLAPMTGNAYVTTGLHEAYHHYLKVITTDVTGLATRRGRTLKAYQIIQSSQLSMYRNDAVPEAKFIYDLSPIAVEYKKKGRHWYDYLTSLMAIIGGTFTLVGMVESGINSALSRSRRTAY